MHLLRFGVIALATAVMAVLSGPMVAAGQVPPVTDVVDGVTDQLPSLPASPVPLPTPVLPAPLPEVQAPAPAPAPVPAPAPALPAPAPSLPTPTLPGSGAGSGQTAQTAPAQSGSGAGDSSAQSIRASTEKRSGAARANAPGDSRKPRRGRDAKARESAEKPARARTQESAEVSAAAALAQDAADLPDDASPETAPFTGLELSLLMGLGVMALGGGLVLRLTARHGFRIARR